MTYVLDTNTVIRLLRKEPAILAHFDNAVRSKVSIAIPQVVDYEILRGFRYREAPTKEQIYQSLCARYPVKEMSSGVWHCAAAVYANLRRNGYAVGDADLLIAAFCIVGDCVLVTNNAKDFENIEGLVLEDWTIQ